MQHDPSSQKAPNRPFLDRLGIESQHAPCHTGLQAFGSAGKNIQVRSPVDELILGKVFLANTEDYEGLIKRVQRAFPVWRDLPAPKRGEIVRQIGDQLRAHKADLGRLVSYEMGKSLQEGLGEVQEMIDICDYAVGLSRSIHGLTMFSERPQHRMMEQWHPLGIVGIISAFNFPVAVWAWNAMIAAVCGNVSIWKPSEKTPLSAIACFNIMKKVLQDNKIPEGVFGLIIGDAAIGERMANDHRLPLLSATGSTRMGRSVGEAVSQRLGKSLLELGGNNAIIMTAHANLKLAIPAIVFGAVGTCGQRCTSTRRLILHPDIYDSVKQSLLKAYQGLRIGNPLDEKNHVGPLIDEAAVAGMRAALKAAEDQSGKIIYGGEILPRTKDTPSSCYVKPAMVEIDAQAPIVQHETFAPILYLLKYSGKLDDAIAMQNQVPQGLSSAIFTDDLKEAERFLAAPGSDCGIANVNIGTSGAEIGGAFGGEKDTGGGRESGSDSWKAYMRRQTNTINYSDILPLAQGIKFDI